MEITEEIKEAMDKAYRECGHNAYFNNGFYMGVKYQQEQSQPKTEWISGEYKMSDKKFCELKTAYTGEKIDNIKQLVKSCFSGEELKEFLEFVINQVTKK